MLILSGFASHLSSDSLVVTVIANRTGFPVLLCVTNTRSLTQPAANTSWTFTQTRSQPRNLRSIAARAGQVTRVISNFKPQPDGPDMRESQRAQLADGPALVQAGRRRATIGRVSAGIGGCRWHSAGTTLLLPCPCCIAWHLSDSTRLWSTRSHLTSMMTTII